MQAFTFNTAARIVCGDGASLELARHCASLGIDSPMLVTDPGLMALGLLEPVIEALRSAGVTPIIFDQVREDPPDHVISSASGQAREAGIDGVIGVGGGSSLDVAKLVAALAGGSQPLAEMYGVDQVQQTRLPLILVPTTAGTGSEVTPVAVVTTGETTKAGVSSSALLPDLAVLDATLTLGLPPAVTAMTGIDAMVHAIEAYTSRHRKNIVSDTLARQALSLLAGNIHTAVHDGQNCEARSNMLLGAMLAGQAFANAPVAAVHALAYPLGGHYHIPHGLSNSLVLPAVLRFNLKVARDLYAELAPVVVNVLPSAAMSPGKTTGAEALIEALELIIRDTELPATLRDAEVPEADLPMLADEAMLQQRLLVNNPRDVSRDDALAIYRAAF